MEDHDHQLQPSPPAQDLQFLSPLRDLIFSSVPALFLKSVVLLKIPDMIASAGPESSYTLSLRQIAARLPSQTPHLDYLSRILRYLSTQGIFIESQTTSSDNPFDFRYGLTDTAKMFFVNQGAKNENPLSLVPFFLMINDETFMNPLHHIHECVLQGQSVAGGAFQIAHGKNLWAHTRENHHSNTVFNTGMESFTKVIMRLFVGCYEGFKPGEKLRVVDVGGGNGAAIAQIVEAHPDIHGINFDLPQVTETAPSIPGVEHVGGDMFDSIPSADVVFIKHVLHNWDDDRCVKILENCHKALPDNGRLIVVEAVLSDQPSPSQEVQMIFDLIMISYTGGGRERSEQQWRRLLEKSGFATLKIAQLPGISSLNILETTKGNCL